MNKNLKDHQLIAKSITNLQKINHKINQVDLKMTATDLHKDKDLFTFEKLDTMIKTKGIRKYKSSYLQSQIDEYKNQQTFSKRTINYNNLQNLDQNTPIKQIFRDQFMKQYQLQKPSDQQTLTNQERLVNYDIQQNESIFFPAIDDRSKSLKNSILKTSSNSKQFDKHQTERNNDYKDPSQSSLIKRLKQQTIAQYRSSNIHNSQADKKLELAISKFRLSKSKLIDNVYDDICERVGKQPQIKKMQFYDDQRHIHQNEMMFTKVKRINKKRQNNFVASKSSCFYTTQNHTKVQVGQKNGNLFLQL